MKWFQNCAARNRARKKKEILEEEFRCTIAFFEQMSVSWFQLAERSLERKGSSAYARKQAAMYGQLKKVCKKL
jgi:hypothetical protein